jgi:hypothetical protein
MKIGALNGNDWNNYEATTIQTALNKNMYFSQVIHTENQNAYYTTILSGKSYETTEGILRIF